MIICPDCHKHIKDEKLILCGSCGWEIQYIGKVPCYLSTEDKESSIISDYISNYDEIASDDISQSVLDERYVFHQINKMVGYISNIDGAHICDIGSGKGGLASALIKAGAGSVVAVDITLEYFKQFELEKQVTPLLANGENLPFREEFDIITSTDVLEHVFNVGSFLISIYEALKPNGRAYIRVPYKENLLNYASRRGCNINLCICAISTKIY